MRRALLLIDVINDFLHPEGVNFHDGYEIILENIKAVLQASRQHNLMIVHVRENHPAHHMEDFEFEKLPYHNASDSFSIEWAPGVEVLPGEYIVQKRRFSAFFETDLNLLLREAQIEQVVIVGVKTHVCIRATSQDAFGWGYRPLLVRDAVGSNHTHLHLASLEDIERYMGKVVSLAEYRELISTDQGVGQRE